MQVLIPNYWLKHDRFIFLCLFCDLCTDWNLSHVKRSDVNQVSWFLFFIVHCYKSVAFWHLLVFTALHGMQRGLTMRFLSVCPSVRPSVCLSVCQTRSLWQNGRKICRDFYTMRKIILSSFMRRRMVGGGRPLLSEILGQPARVGAKSPILNQ